MGIQRKEGEQGRWLRCRSSLAPHPRISSRRAAFSGERRRKRRRRKDSATVAAAAASKEESDEDDEEMALIASMYMLRTCFSHRRLGCDQDSSHNWAVSEESFRRYVVHASERCIEELLAASMVEEDAGEGWRAVKARRGVAEFGGRSVVGEEAESGSRCLPPTSPPSSPLPMHAINTAKHWDPYFVEGQYLKSLQENVDIVRLVFGAKSGPLFRNREFIVYERRETMHRCRVRWQRGWYRGVVVLQQSGWVIDQKHSITYYMAQLDPLGWLPKWLVIDDLQKVAGMIEQQST